MSSTASNDFKKRKELEEARKAGTAEVNAIVSTNVVASAAPVDFYSSNSASAGAR
jgi:hypothetical protein